MIFRRRAKQKQITISQFFNVNFIYHLECTYLLFSYYCFIFISPGSADDLHARRVAVHVNGHRGEGGIRRSEEEPVCWREEQDRLLHQRFHAG